MKSGKQMSEAAIAEVIVIDDADPNSGTGKNAFVFPANHWVIDDADVVTVEPLQPRNIATD